MRISDWSSDVCSSDLGLSGGGGMSLLEIRGLRVRFGVQEILRGVDLDLGEGEILAVLGSNGVGKTTLMRTVSGVYQAAGGTVRLRGEDIAGRPAHRIVAMGLSQAPEGRQIFSNMTVRENLVLGRSEEHT